ncbi:CUGBP Elav-like family member 1 [Oryzias melastigma]|uniref:CUGBP Elav-like family member 1 n=1 Tax=Oryzias melastigma TaxID=30732 RepID=UPI00168CF563|nr:CUGBP Elav-like family member 1 [Oryzias melastigma]
MVSGCAFATFTARQMAQAAIKSMHQSQTMEVPVLTLLSPPPPCSQLLYVAGILLPHRGEVCRHQDGQGAEVSGSAAADAAAQLRLHVGEPDRFGSLGPQYLALYLQLLQQSASPGFRSEYHAELAQFSSSSCTGHALGVQHHDHL